MAWQTFGLLAYALATGTLTIVVWFAQREENFPLPLARRAAAVVLSLDSALGWIALGGDEDLLASPGWLMSLALVAAANLVAALGTLLRAVSLPPWLRWLTAAACLFSPPALGMLVL